MKRTRVLGAVFAALLLMGFSYGPKVLVKVVDANGDAVAGAVVTINDAFGAFIDGGVANNGGVYKAELGNVDPPITVEAESPDGSLTGTASAEIFKKGKGTTVIRVIVEAPAFEVPEFHESDGDFTYGAYPPDGFYQPNFSLSILNPGAYLLGTDRLRFLPLDETTGAIEDGVFLAPGTSIWFGNENAVIGGLSVDVYLAGFNGIEVLNPDGTVRLRLLP